MERERVRIRFELEQDDSGYPPADSEMIWAVPVAGEHYRVDNVPFFVYGISYCDVVSVSKGNDGLLRFKDLIREGGHSTLRVIVHDAPTEKKSLDERTDTLREQLTLLGCPSEKSHIKGLISVDVPPERSLGPIKEVLEAGVKQDLWGYEEATIAFHKN
jgi:Domain of unknown function (DUF4265)